MKGPGSTKLESPPVMGSGEGWLFIHFSLGVYFSSVGKFHSTRHLTSCTLRLMHTRLMHQSLDYKAAVDRVIKLDCDVTQPRMVAPLVSLY
jgi:hypothetical protein